MKIEEGFGIGYIFKTHGKDGEVVLAFNTIDPLKFKELQLVFLLLDNQPVPFFIDYITINQQKATVKFEDVNSLEEAEKLKNAEVLIHQDNVPEEELENLEWNRLIGYIVKDEYLGELGEIIQIYRVPGNDLMAMNYKGKEVLIPFNDNIIVSINHYYNQVEVALPEGLLDIYLNI